jgi:transposase
MTIVQVESVQEKGDIMPKRRAFTPEFKARVVLEELTGLKDKGEICREYRLRPQMFSRWREQFLERAPEIFATQSSRGDEEARIVELERMVGRLTMELEAAKKVSDILTSLSTRNGR